MSTLSRGAQTFRIAFLGLTFMLIFTAFNSLQNIVSKLYEQYHYDHLGQTALITLYGTFGICTFFTSYVIKTFGYKRVMLMASLGYAAFEMTGLIVAAQLGIPAPVIWIIVLAGAILCGLSAAMIWVAQGAYTSQVASADRKSQLFGLFWGLMMSSQIFGNLLTVFVLGRLTNFIYFVILTIFGGLSSFLFIFLPPTQTQPVKPPSIKSEIQKITKIIKDPKYRMLNIYFLFPGLCVAFYAAYIYKLINLAVKRQEGQSDDDFQHRGKYSAGLVFMTLGLSQLFTGIMMNLFSERFCKFKLAIVGTLMVQAACFVSFVCYFLESYVLCFFVAFLWGSSETFIQTNTGGLISMVFPSRVQAFSVYRVIFALGVVLTICLSIALSTVPPYVFLTIILLCQICVTGVSVNMMSLKDQIQPESGKQSLLSNAKDEVDAN